jgi:hypothetical protein
MKNQDTGINSTVKNDQGARGGKITPEEQVLVNTLKDMGLSEERIQDALNKKRAKGK